MMSYLKIEIDNAIFSLSNEDSSKGFRGAMESAHLDDNIPCPICDEEIYYRTYEKVESMCQFGDD